MKTQSTKMERNLSTLLVLAILLLIGTFLVARSEYFEIRELRRERAAIDLQISTARTSLERAGLGCAVGNGILRLFQ